MAALEQTLELTEDAGFLLMALRSRWRQRVWDGRLWCVCPKTRRALEVDPDALTELEEMRLALLPVNGGGRVVLTARGDTYARLVALHHCGDRRATMGSMIRRSSRRWRSTA